MNDIFDETNRGPAFVIFEWNKGNNICMCLSYISIRLIELHVKLSLIECDEMINSLYLIFHFNVKVQRIWYIKNCITLENKSKKSTRYQEGISVLILLIKKARFSVCEYQTYVRIEMIVKVNTSNEMVLWNWVFGMCCSKMS